MSGFDVRLDGFDEGAQEPPVAALCRLFGLSREVSAELVAGLPRVVKRDVDHDLAQRIVAALHGVGGHAVIVPHAADADAGPARPSSPAQVSVPVPRVSEVPPEALEHGPTPAFAPIDIDSSGGTGDSSRPLELGDSMEDATRRSSTMPPRPSGHQDTYVAGTNIPSASARPPPHPLRAKAGATAAAAIRVLSLATVLAVISAIAYALSR